MCYVCRVNPVSGYVEPQRPSPFAGMSEEQKEHEAVKLANIIDRLHSLGVVKPGKLGKLVDIIYIEVWEQVSLHAEKNTSYNI